jgi:streptogramin lyase
MRQLSFIALISAFVSSCSFHAMGPAQTAPSYTSPQVVQRGAGSSWVKFNPHTFGALGAGIIAGPDGNMWFIDENAGDLVRLSMGGAIKEFTMSGFLGGNAIALTVGADHKFYIANESSKIVRVTTSGVVQAFTNSSGDSTDLGDIALGPDGNVWFPETRHLGMITPAGVITEIPYPASFGVPNQYGTITTGSDGDLWFNETGDNSIVKYVIATQKFTEFKPPGTGCTPAGLVKAKDNNVWFTCTQQPPQVGRITKAGNIKLFPGGGGFSGEETFQIATLGADGNPWYSSPDTGSIFRVNTSNGAVTSFSPPFISGERPDSVAAGPDGNIWVTTVGLSNVYIRVFNPMTLSPRSITFSNPGTSENVTVTENGTTAWTATSSDTSVATVAQGSPADTFVITAVGPGTCRIKISDAKTNSAFVSILVM